MRKIGIIGGIGWPSTIEYYRHICELSQAYHADKEFLGPVPMPEIVIESLDMNFTISNRGSGAPGSWDKCDKYFNDALRRLQNSGADVIAIASVTPHSRLTERSNGIHVPVLSIYSAIGSYCINRRISKLLVLGTMPTMTTPNFVDGVSSHGIDAFYPESDDVKSQLVSIINSLYQNNVLSAKSNIDALVRTCLGSAEIKDTVVCLACTELPLAFGNDGCKAEFSFNGVSYLNSSIVHASSIFSACLE